MNRDKHQPPARHPVKAFENEAFLANRPARSLRILSEYLEPESRFARYRIVDTIVFMGSARFIAREQAEQDLAAAHQSGSGVERAEMRLETSHYYEAARELAGRLTTWSKRLNDEEHRFVVCTGGGPGIMEAANRGASEAKGMNIGMTIEIPDEETVNPYVTRELGFQFHYFFMRKFWFAYLAKAVILFPGGYGTFDEMFELLTLIKTQKITKHMPVVLFGREFWDKVINFEELVRHGTIDRRDLDIMFATDSVEEACDYLVGELTKFALADRGARL